MHERDIGCPEGFDKIFIQDSSENDSLIIVMNLLNKKGNQ
jgi:hypothetical protein